MKICVQLCLLLAATATIVGFAEAKDKVIAVKGEKEFASLIKDNDFVAVEFFAPWCGHCKALAPEWEAAAVTLEAEDPKIKLASVDCTLDENKALATEYEIKGYPTIKIFSGNDAKKPRDYEGPREAKGIVEHVSKQAGPATVPLNDAAAVKAFQKLEGDKTCAVIGVFPSGAKGADFDAFSSAANSLRNDYEFGHVTDAALIPDAKGVAVVLFTDDSKAPTVIYDGKLVAADIEAWVEKTLTPALVTLEQTPKNKKALQKIFTSTLPKLLGFAGEGEETEAIKAALTDLSATSSDLNVLFGALEGNAGAMEYFGLAEKDAPAFVIHDQENGDAKFNIKNVKASDLATFYKDFKAGKLVKLVKSEDAPASNDGPVTILTAKTFDDLVFSKPRNVFIEFYAPWCGHCKKLEPIWEKLGKAFQDNDSVVIAKMDTTANDVPDPKKFKVIGFPTIKLVKADGVIIDYEGDRSETSLLEFVNSHADSKAEYKDEL